MLASIACSKYARPLLVVVPSTSRIFAIIPAVYLSAVAASASDLRYEDEPPDSFNLRVISIVNFCADCRYLSAAVMLSTHSIPDCEHKDRQDRGPMP